MKMAGIISVIWVQFWAVLCNDLQGTKEKRSRATAGAAPPYLVVFGIGHVFGFHSAVLGRLAGELHEEQQLFEDGRVHDLQILRAHTDGLQQGGNAGTNTADIRHGTAYCIIQQIDTLFPGRADTKSESVNSFKFLTVGFSLIKWERICIIWGYFLKVIKYISLTPLFFYYLINLDFMTE